MLLFRKFNRFITFVLSTTIVISKILNEKRWKVESEYNYDFDIDFFTRIECNIIIGIDNHSELITEGCIMALA